MVERAFSGRDSSAQYLLIVEANVMIADDHLQLHVAAVPEHLLKPLDIIRPGLREQEPQLRASNPPPSGKNRILF